MKTKFYKTIAIYTLLASVLVGCDNNRLDVDVSNIDPELNIQHFDDAYYQNDSADFYSLLPELQQNYPLFFTSGDSMIWVDYRFSPQLAQLYTDSKRAIPTKTRDQVEELLSSGFQHLHYYFPNTPKFTIYTRISGLDFGYPIIYVDSLQTIFIATDLYMGIHHPAYDPIPEYIARRFNADHIAPDVFGAIAAERIQAQDETETLLHEMIRMGIIRYFQESMLPNVNKNLLFGYSLEEMEFCKNNEVNIWTFMVEQQMLFDTSLETKRRFLFEAPFSKFFTDIDNKTPGRIGEWIGWNIVHSYMANHDEVTLADLMSVRNYEQLFRDSQYKPVR